MNILRLTLIVISVLLTVLAIASIGTVENKIVGILFGAAAIGYFLSAYLYRKQFK